VTSCRAVASASEWAWRRDSAAWSWYRTAVALAPVRTARLTAVGEVAERFRHARRILNHLADQYLLGPGSPWSTAPG